MQNIIIRNLNGVTVHSFTNNDIIFLSPLLTITDMKQYIYDVLSDIVVFNNSDPSHIILWSPVGNIEYDHPEIIYRYGMDIMMFTKKYFPDSYDAFDTGPIYIVGDFGAMKNTSPSETSLDKTSLDKTSLDKSFYHELYNTAIGITQETSARYSNIFKSSFILEDHQDVVTVSKKLNMSCNMTTYFRKITLVSGDIIPIEPSNDNDLFYFTILKDNNVMFVISNKKIVVNDIEVFQLFLSEMMKIKDIVIPERYNNSVMYTFKTSSNINQNLYDNEHLEMFFTNNKEWNIKNILMSKNSKMIIFLSKTTIKIKTTTSYIGFAIHASKILEAISILSGEEEDLSLFGKTQGIYWSRICQNSQDIIRKPIKSVVTSDDNTNYTDNHLILDGYKYECLSEWESKYIGILKKPYEIGNICLPCCYKIKQTSKSIFKKCFEDSVILSDISTYSLFIIDGGRVLNKRRLGFMEDQYNLYMNKNNKIKLDGKMLVSCNEYFLLSGNNPISIVNNNDDIIDFLNENPNIVIIRDNTFCTSRYIEKHKPISYIYQMKDQYYKVVSVTKDANSDQLTIKEEYNILDDILVYQSPFIEASSITNIAVIKNHNKDSVRYMVSKNRIF